MTNLIGQTLLNQYRVDAFVASGGMGAVYRVLDLKRNVPLAMKVLHADLAEDPSIFKRFEREARALKKLAHPNIVPFYGLFKTSDLAFLLEQYIDGPTLKQVLRQRETPLPVEEALIYLKALCAALGYAHAHGVVHCDVKPGNVMIDRGGSIYLTDFGVARHAESTTTTLGGAGTPAYMAPEQCRGEAVTAATDVYALGVMLYEMVIGSRPFQGNTTGTKEGSTAGELIRYAHLHNAPPDPCQANPALSRTLGDVILKALEKDPRGRYASAWAMLEAACAAVGTDPHAVPDRVLASRTVNATASGAEAEPSPVMRTPQPNAAAAIPLPQRQRQGIVIIVGIIVVVAAVTAIAVKVIRPVPISVSEATMAVATPSSTEAPTIVPSSRPTDSPRALTAMPIPTSTSFPGATGNCPDAKFVADVTVPEGTHFDKDKEFVKTWKALNNGSCDWPDGAYIAYAAGEKMGAPDALKIGAVKSGDSVEISVKMKTPDRGGNYEAIWRLIDSKGVIFGEKLTVSIVVEQSQAATATATVTCPPVTGPFASIWQSAKDRLGCAASNAHVTWMAEEVFQRGRMFWRQDKDDKYVIAVYSNSTWGIYLGDWKEGDPSFTCGPESSPPTPQRGFGRAWCKYPEIRNGLGNATTAEWGYDGTVQDFARGMILRTDSGTTFVLYSGDRKWEAR